LERRRLLASMVLDLSFWAVAMLLSKRKIKKIKRPKNK
jgi:hypothetical protein